VSASSLERRVELLRATSFFRDASSELLRELAEGCVDLDLEAGGVLCRAGDVGDSLYIVDSGTLEIYLDDAPLDKAGRGACLGEMALITEQTRSASIRAIEPARVLSLDRRIFAQILNAHPDLAWGIFRELSEKIRSSIDVRVKQHRTNKLLTDAFERSVSRAVMDEILKRRDPANLLEGSTQQATVLFADVRSFTSLSETMAPKEIIDILNEYLSAMVDVILDLGGTLDKFMGDGILAHFGVPLPGKNDAASALRCAGQMHARLRELNVHGVRLCAHPLHIGVGLATGMVVAGCVGSARRMEYTVIGDIVNLASRMEGLTKIYGVDVLSCAETARQTRDAITQRRIDVVRVKGKAHATELWSPAGESLTASAWSGLDKAYSAAFDLYAGGDFDRGGEAFDALLREYPGDGPSIALRERCRAFAQSPPEGWDGVFIIKSK
jgi:class 3 adenylate cyclase